VQLLSLEVSNFNFNNLNLKKSIYFCFFLLFLLLLPFFLLLLLLLVLVLVLLVVSDGESLSSSHCQSPGIGALLWYCMPPSCVHVFVCCSKSVTVCS
jgi:hypothetical protein